MAFWRCFTPFLILISFLSCTMKRDPLDQDADLLIYNAYVYPVNGDPLENGAVAIRNGKILQVGTTSDLMTIWGSHTHKKFDAKGSFLMPGFIEGHGHFHNLGLNLLQLDLLDTHSWPEIV
ncbi:MAG TPA: hypothetical protein VJ508_05000, partial [Saprospiraceae bacterium]|nr:hypothetical protein [Saprospiraceae bacterium]